jgi:hypothetical protein
MNPESPDVVMCEVHRARAVREGDDAEWWLSLDSLYCGCGISSHEKASSGLGPGTFLPSDCGDYPRVP